MLDRQGLGYSEQVVVCLGVQKNEQRGHRGLGSHGTDLRTSADGIRVPGGGHAGGPMAVSPLWCENRALLKRFLKNVKMVL